MNIQKYIEKLGFKYTTFPALGFYGSNFQLFDFFKATVDPADGALFIGIAGLRADVALPIVDPRDVGIIALAALKDPQKYGKGNFIPVAYDYYTADRLAKEFEEVTGKRAKPRFVPFEIAAPKIPVGELRETIEWFNKYGYYAGRDISQTRKEFPTLKSWKDWLLESKWTG